MRTEETLRQLSTLRDDLVRLVTRLSPEQLSQSGVHGVLGEMTIPEWVEFFLLHEAHHLYAAMQRARGG